MTFIELENFYNEIWEDSLKILKTNFPQIQEKFLKINKPILKSSNTLQNWAARITLFPLKKNSNYIEIKNYIFENKKISKNEIKDILNHEFAHLFASKFSSKGHDKIWKTFNILLNGCNIYTNENIQNVVLEEYIKNDKIKKIICSKCGIEMYFTKKHFKILNDENNKNFLLCCNCHSKIS